MRLSIDLILEILYYRIFRCDVSGDGQMDIQELAAFLKASVGIYSFQRLN